MSLKTFIENIASLYDETDASVFEANTEFKNLDEWSSLMALSIIAMIDEEYDMQIKGDDIRNAVTISDLYENIKLRGKV